MMYEAIRASSGIVSDESDLWCTYAAVRTLKWLDRIKRMEHPDAVVNYVLSRQNADGGYAWSVGMNSDAWATYYCTQTLQILEEVRTKHPRRSTSQWVWSAHNPDGGFGMMPGQSSDVWATYYAVRTLVEIHGETLPESLKAWLSALQAKDGGLTWSPAHARDGNSDVRACYYAITAWITATRGECPLPWDRYRLLNWLRGRQSAEGGFTFQEGDDTDCLWATFRAASAFRQIGEKPRDLEGCIGWIRNRQQPNESFTRWPGYPLQDVWAAFCGTGALKELGDDVSDIADHVTAVIHSFQIPGGGFTYRPPPLASDTLTTAAYMLSGRVAPSEAQRCFTWLENCVMPNENGIMYMPGRGSEVRCTLWGLCAGAFERDPSARERIAQWLLTAIQNPDGGFGYWEGRASDLVSTSAATEILYRTQKTIDPLTLLKIAEFIRSCEVSRGEFGNVPGATPTLRATLQAFRVLRRAGMLSDCAPVGDALERHRVRGGGFANEGARLPDLLSTYEAVLAADMFDIPLDTDHLNRFMNCVRVGDRQYSWTPLVKLDGGPLANCFGTYLGRRLSGQKPELPPLVVS